MKVYCSIEFLRSCKNFTISVSDNITGNSAIEIENRPTSVAPRENQSCHDYVKQFHLCTRLHARRIPIPKLNRCQYDSIHLHRFVTIVLFYTTFETETISIVSDLFSSRQCIWSNLIDFKLKKLETLVHKFSSIILMLISYLIKISFKSYFFK